MTVTSDEDVLANIKKLSAKSADPIRLAAALAQLEAGPSPSPNIATLVEITGKSRRTLGYLRNIGKRLGELGLKERTFFNLGWTKSLEIARLCTKETLHEALDYAEGHTVIQLRRYLTGEKEIKPTRAVNLRLSDKQYTLFRKVLLAHGAVPVGKGLRHQEAALIKALRTMAKSAAK